jgi:uncharacterized protein (TIGR03083 family)
VRTVGADPYRAGMDFQRYVESLRADADLLARAARRDLTAKVPSCPGWTVRDVVEHVAVVYLHKIECMRLGHAPDPWPPAPPAGDPVDWLEESLTDLIAELTSRGPAAPCFTWYEPDQTVGFWYRRMAQETAVHRVDAELAFGPPTPVAADTAVDGIDEVLEVMLAGDWSDEPQPGPTQVVALQAGEQNWRVTLEPDAVAIAHEAGPAEASVAGSASDVLLWLWRRSDPSWAQLAFSGDVNPLYDRLFLVTQ